MAPKPPAALDAEQRQVLQLVYDRFRRDGRWPKLGQVSGMLLKAGRNPTTAIESVPQNLIRLDKGESPEPASNLPVRLSLQGIANCEGGRQDVERLLRLLRWLARKRHHLMSRSTEAVATVDEIMQFLGLTSESGTAVARLREILKLEPCVRVLGSSTGDGDWSVVTTRQVARLSKVKTLADYLASHARLERERDHATTRIRFFGKAASAVGVVASLVIIFAYLGWNPFISAPARHVPPPSPATVVDRIIQETDKIRMDPIILNFTIRLRRTCASETVRPAGQLAMKCWLILSEFYDSASRFGSAIDAINRARQINTGIADPYYELGNEYYHMLLFDLTLQKRYRVIDPKRLLVDVFPNSDSMALASLAANQFQQARGLPFIARSVAPTNQDVTAQNDIALAEAQIAAVNNGARALMLSEVDILDFVATLLEVNPKNKIAIQMFPVLLKYIREHPDQFPGLYLPKGVR